MKGILLVALFAVTAPGQTRAQDAVAGKKVFAACKACHQVGDDAKNAVGPVLNSLFGRRAGSVADFSYSEANRNSRITWDEAAFSKYIKDPKTTISGTKKLFAGIRDEQNIGDLTAYLHEFDKTPVKLLRK